MLRVVDQLMAEMAQSKRIQVLHNAQHRRMNSSLEKQPSSAQIHVFKGLRIMIGYSGSSRKILTWVVTGLITGHCSFALVRTCLSLPNKGASFSEVT